MSRTAKRKISRSRRTDGEPSMVDGVMEVRLRHAKRLTARELVQFCQDNSELRVEQTAEGELIIMAPAFSESSNQNFKLCVQFGVWQAEAGSGQLFDSSGGFRLSNGAMRSPDVSWVAQERLDKMTAKDWQGFMPLCPDFVLELRSRSDRLPKLHEKMAEYLDNGARLGWLIDPLEKQVFVYRPGAKVEHLKNPATLSGEPVLAGFTLDLARVW